MAGGQPHTKRDVGGQDGKASKEKKSGDGAASKSPAAGPKTPAKAPPKPR